MTKTKFFKVDSLFKVKSSRKIFNANRVKRNGLNHSLGYPYVVRRNYNNGTRGRLVKPVKYLNPANTISFGQDSTAIYYQPTSYFTGDKVKILIPRKEVFGDSFNRNLGLYIITAMRKAFTLFTWGEYKFNMTVIRNMTIQLPVDNDGQLNTKYMNKVISKLINKYEHLLIARFKKSIKSIHTKSLSKPNLIKVPLQHLFTISKITSFNKNKLNSGTQYDYITRTRKNQGIEETTGLINKRGLNPAGTWSLGLQQTTFFYRPRPWYAGQYVKIIKPKFKLDKYVITYFESLFSKIQPLIHAELVSNTEKEFNKMLIKVPITSNGKLDTDYIDNLIKNDKIKQLKRAKAICNSIP